MNRAVLFWVIVGALAFYAFARWRGAIVGAPWAPAPAVMGKHAAGS